MIGVDKRVYGFYKDDGTPVNPTLVPKPSLCVSCKLDNDPKEEIPCTLNRMDQQGCKEFICFAYQPKS